MTACPSRNVLYLRFESRGSRAIEVLEDKNILTSTRRSDGEESPYVSKREIVPTAAVGFHIKTMNALSRSAQTVIRREILDFSAT